MSYYIMMKFNLYCSRQQDPRPACNSSQQNCVYGWHVNQSSLADLPVPLFYGRGYCESKADLPAWGAVRALHQYHETPVSQMMAVSPPEDPRAVSSGAGTIGCAITRQRSL
jgi:hypothetical protein